MLTALEIGGGLALLTMLTSLGSVVRPWRLRTHQLVVAGVVVAALAPVAVSYGELRECQKFCALDFESCKKSCADVGGFDGCEVECRWVDDGCLSECTEARYLTDHPSAPTEHGGGRRLDARSTR